MSGKARPSLRRKTLSNVDRSNLSITDKKCIHAVFELVEQQNAKVSATSYHGEVISGTYTFTVEIETDNIIGAKEQIAMALEGVGKVAFTNVCTKSNHLVELPFLPGDDLYWINDDTQEIERQPNGIEAVVYYGNGKFKIVDDGVIDDVGGQWTLLSREDAERFLREKMKKE